MEHNVSGLSSYGALEVLVRPPDKGIASPPDKGIASQASQASDGASPLRTWPQGTAPSTPGGGDASPRTDEGGMGEDASAAGTAAASLANSSSSSHVLVRLGKGRRALLAAGRLGQQLQRCLGDRREVALAFQFWAAVSAQHKQVRFLREVVTDRTAFLDELRAAYLRDVIVLKEQMVRELERCGATPPEALLALPSADLRRHLLQRWRLPLGEEEGGAAGAGTGRAPGQAAAAARRAAAALGAAVGAAAARYLHERREKKGEDDGEGGGGGGGVEGGGEGEGEEEEEQEGGGGGGDEEEPYGDYFGLTDVSLPLRAPAEVALFVKPCADCLGLAKLVHRRTAQVEAAIALIPRVTALAEGLEAGRARELLLAAQYEKLQAEYLAKARAVEKLEARQKGQEEAARWFAKVAGKNAKSDAVIERLSQELATARATTQSVRTESREKLHELQLQTGAEIARLKMALEAAREERDAARGELEETRGELGFALQERDDARRAGEGMGEQARRAGRELEEEREKLAAAERLAGQRDLKRFKVADENNALRLQVSALERQVKLLDGDRASLAEDLQLQRGEAARLAARLGQITGNKRHVSTMAGPPFSQGVPARVQCDLGGGRAGPLGRSPGPAGAGAGPLRRLGSGDSVLTDPPGDGDSATLRSQAREQQRATAQQLEKKLRGAEARLKNAQRAEASAKARSDQKLEALRREMAARVAEERALAEKQRGLAARLAELVTLMRREIDRLVGGGESPFAALLFFNHVLGHNATFFLHTPCYPNTA